MRPFGKYPAVTVIILHKIIGVPLNCGRTGAQMHHRFDFPADPVIPYQFQKRILVQILKESNPIYGTSLIFCSFMFLVPGSGLLFQL